MLQGLLERFSVALPRVRVRSRRYRRQGVVALDAGALSTIPFRSHHIHHCM